MGVLGRRNRSDTTSGRIWDRRRATVRPRPATREPPSFLFVLADTSGPWEQIRIALTKSVPTRPPRARRGLFRRTKQAEDLPKESNGFPLGTSDRNRPRNEATGPSASQLRRIRTLRIYVGRSSKRPKKLPRPRTSLMLESVRQPYPVPVDLDETVQASSVRPQARRISCTNRPCPSLRRAKGELTRRRSVLRCDRRLTRTKVARSFGPAPSRPARLRGSNRTTGAFQGDAKVTANRQSP